MLAQPFTLQLNNAIAKAAVGKFDGEHASLTCATSAGKVFFGRASELAGAEQLRFLNINRKISALACGALNAKQGRDMLLVGAQTTLLAYDVRENCDLFFKDVPDGVNTLLVGRFGSLDIPLALVGGNCSIQGFDHEGGESFWTVTGDNVSAMAFCDVDGDGELELLVGSDDFEIRVFRNEEVVSETTETEKYAAARVAPPPTRRRAPDETRYLAPDRPQNPGPDAAAAEHVRVRARQRHGGSLREAGPAAVARQVEARGDRHLQL